MSHQEAALKHQRRRYTSLRIKTFLIIVTTLIGLLVMLYVPLRILLLGSFIELEEQHTRQDIERVLHALASDTAKLDRTTGDYAAWDDTYAFVEDANQEYITTNLIDAVFVTNKLSLAAIVDTTGKVVHSKAFDLNTDKPLPAPEFFRTPLTTDDPLLRHQSIESSTTGIIVLPEGPMIVAARPILTSAYTGPPRGTLIMGLALDSAEIQSLAETTGLALQIVRLDDSHAPPDTQVARTNLSKAALTFVQPLDERSIAGYALLNDIYGVPGLILRVEMPRTIYAQGQTSMLYSIGTLLVAGIVFALVMLVLLERVVLSRLISLSSGVSRIGASGDLAARVSVNGEDELSQLASAINTMMSTLEQAQIERRQAEKERARLQEEIIRSKEQIIQMAIHDLKNPLTAINGFLAMLRQTRLNDMQHELLEGARRGSAGMLQIVETILDTARLEEGRLELRRESSDVATMLHGCVDDLRAWAEQERKQIEVVVPTAMPPLLIDAGLMRRVVINLLSNAIKHTPMETAITLGADVDAGGARLYVRDSGLGIPPERERHLFERFGAGTRTGNGQSSTGLGLNFCKLAVEAHDGSIAVRSAMGQGTTFTITLPPQCVADLPVAQPLA